MKDYSKTEFSINSLVKYRHASFWEIGIIPQRDWEERFGGKTFQVVSAKKVLVGYPVLNLLTEYSVIEYPRKAMSYTLTFLQPQLCKI